MKSLVFSIAFALILPMAIIFARLRPPLDLTAVVFGLIVLGPLCAAIFGHAALRQFKKKGDVRVGPRLLAVAGLCLGYLELALVIFSFLASGHRSEPYESIAVGSLRTLNFATHAYTDAHPAEGFPASLLKMRFDAHEPTNNWSLDPMLANGTKSHYRFTYLPRQVNRTGIIDGYRIFADPLDPKNKDLRHFFTDQTEIIRMARGAPANESSTALQ